MTKKNSRRDYQVMSAELTKIIEWFEGDEVNLDGAVVKYEQALKLIAEIESYLKSAGNKVKKISAKFE